MKKYIVAGIVSALALVQAGTAQAETAVPITACAPLATTLRFRSADSRTGGEVSRMQIFLKDTGYFKFDPTGYFGVITLQALKVFQKANGIPPTGLAGPLTRAKIKEISCTGKISIMFPKPNSVWEQGSVQTVRWISELPPSLVAYQYSANLMTYRELCKDTCPLKSESPIQNFELVQATTSQEFSWTVGISNSNMPVPNDSYVVRICVKNDPSACASSGKVSVVSASTSTKGVTYQVYTDKNLYHQSEPIKIMVTAKNTDKEPRKLTFGSGCEASYKIGVEYDYMKDSSCIAISSDFWLKSGESKTWVLVHEPSVKQLSSGTYSVEGIVLNAGASGSATANITVY